MEKLVDAAACGEGRAIGLSDVVLENLVRTLYVVPRGSQTGGGAGGIASVSAADGAVGILPAYSGNLLAFGASAPLGHVAYCGIRPAGRVRQFWPSAQAKPSLTPAQVLLAWGIQRGTAVLTTAKTLERARENYNISEIPEAAVDEINRIQTRSRLNSVVATGVPGFYRERRLTIKPRRAFPPSSDFGATKSVRLK